MKCKLVNAEIDHDYMRELMRCRGIIDFDEYLHPFDSCIQDPVFLSNIEDAAALLNAHIQKYSNIGLVVDADVDGYTSAAIIYKYIKKIAPTIEIFYYLHEHKGHGLTDLIDQIIEDNIQHQYGLIILPDSSSNDYEFHDDLKKHDIQCLILDHHLADGPFSDNAVIVNNQLSKSYENKDLTGAGVTWQFCRFYDVKYGYHYAGDYVDLAALGIIGDMGSALQIENRTIMVKGLKNIKNFFFKTLIEKQSFSMQNQVTPITVAFYIVPLINAMIRVGSMEEKHRLWQAFLNGTMPVQSHKRGAREGEMELLAVESARECANAKARQERIKTKATDIMETRIRRLGLLDNQILFVRLEDEDDFPAELNGLIATQLGAKFKKPTIVARPNDDGYIRGSARGLNNSALESFKDFLDNTHMFEYAQGHDNAFGISLPAENLAEFIAYSNEALKDYDFGESYYNVNFIRDASAKDLMAIILDVGQYEDVFGQNNPEVSIYVKNINIRPTDIRQMKNNTISFEKFGVTYIMFRAAAAYEAWTQYEDIHLDIVGKPQINRWGGREVPQMVINHYECSDGAYAF